MSLNLGGKSTNATRKTYSIEQFKNSKIEKTKFELIFLDRYLFKPVYGKPEGYFYPNFIKTDRGVFICYSFFSVYAAQKRVIFQTSSKTLLLRLYWPI